MQRDFTAEQPFEKLTTDVTQFNVCGEKVYLSPTLALYNREIVSSSVSLSPNLEQIREMLNGLFEKLHEYIYYYNNERISRKLKGMSPVQYRTHSQAI